ncbi:phosphoribosylformylglycinamidine synthase subunit PurS [Paenisporosarcina cavernae]|uniref:Phosphoribosylformylglycinamidine synthase subunit PurS n=1 Tax=Paenisporosarcina cavernae TaxID=2320858 RepID=A0A385YXK5_9BACL|nr:phosphoribosylformylglycinamidine synthase subunit PurS [Paenisporosarcina cavernae]AYC30313.1 phosphoribosylformylglycinamidine synthase subunit PurS [Paenisporosarcina cavernae]
MKKVNIFVTLRESILDPQGSAVKGALHSHGFPEVQDVRIGKYLELMIDDSVEDIDAAVNEMCQKLLTNTVIENYRFEIEEVAAI